MGLNEIDFTSCPRVPGRAYNGANGKKIAVLFEQATWLLKFPPPTGARMTSLSYSNSCFPEHLGSTIFRLLGIPAQETRLGTHLNGRLKVVCACRDFTIPGKRFYDFCSIKNSVIDSETGGTGTELADVLQTIELQSFMDPVDVRHRFWDMFVVDALLGNFDRHNGNWGFLVDDATNAVSLAPVFDCGSCLLPQADESVMRKVLSDEAELAARIYTFPGSMLKQNGRKINYADFLREADDVDFRAAYARLRPRIAELDFGALIDATPYLDELQRCFLLTYLRARRSKLFGL